MLPGQIHRAHSIIDQTDSISLSLQISAAPMLADTQSQRSSLPFGSAQAPASSIEGETAAQPSDIFDQNNDLTEADTIEESHMPTLASLFGAQQQSASQIQSRQSGPSLDPAPHVDQEPPSISANVQSAASEQETEPSGNSTSQSQELFEEATGSYLSKRGAENTEQRASSARASDKNSPAREHKTDEAATGGKSSVEECYNETRGNSSGTTSKAESGPVAGQAQNGGHPLSTSDSTVKSKKEQKPTADAVAEAIKAATAVTGGPGRLPPLSYFLHVGITC